MIGFTEFELIHMTFPQEYPFFFLHLQKQLFHVYGKKCPHGGIPCAGKENRLYVLPYSVFRDQ